MKKLKEIPRIPSNEDDPLMRKNKIEHPMIYYWVEKSKEQIPEIFNRLKVTRKFQRAIDRKDYPTLMKMMIETLYFGHTTLAGDTEENIIEIEKKLGLGNFKILCCICRDENKNASWYLNNNKLPRGYSNRNKFFKTLEDLVQKGYLIKIGIEASRFKKTTYNYRLNRTIIWDKLRLKIDDYVKD